MTAGIFAEWRARAAEGRAEQRMVDAETRAQARERERDRHLLQRKDWLRALDETAEDVAATLQYLVARADGSKERMGRANERRSGLRRRHFYLIGGEDAMRRFLTVTDELTELEPGAKSLTEEQAARAGAVQGEIVSALDRQRQRVFAGQDPIWVSPAFARSLVKENGDRYEIPQEFRPQVRED